MSYIEYSQEICNKICDLVSNGSNLNALAQMQDMPNPSTVYAWFKKYPDFEKQYLHARETRASWRADKIDQVIMDLRAGVIDSNMARVEIDAIKWQAGKENQRLYGDKQQIDHSGNLTLSQLVAASYEKDVATS